MQKQQTLTTLVFSQVLLIAGALTVGIGTIAALTTESSWLYTGLGLASIGIGILTLKRWLRQVPTRQASPVREIVNLVMRYDITKLVIGLSLCVAGLLMIGVGFIISLAFATDWLYLCLIGLVSAAFGGWLMQGEVRGIVSSLRASKLRRGK